MKLLYSQQIANSYDVWFNTPKGRVVDRIVREAIHSYLEPQRGMKLLDIGCGTGQYSLDLALIGLDTTGVDVSPSMLERARIKAEEAGLNARFIEADAQSLPFSDETFDLVFTVEAMEYVSDFSAALREAFRVLRIGGRLVVGFTGRDNPWWRLHADKASGNPDSPFHFARFYTLDELLAAMPGRNVQGKTVLFVPPDFDFTQEDRAMAIEEAAVCAGRNDGAFVCAVSVK